MADVDFSHAVLALRTDIETVKPMSDGTYVYLDASYLLDANRSIITSGFTNTKITNTPTKVSMLMTGTFTASGTEFYIGDVNGGSNRYCPWKVSNISFNNGDTFSFIIDIETSGNV